MLKLLDKNNLEKPCTNFIVAFSRKDLSDVDANDFFLNENVANLFIKCVDVGI